LDVNEEGKLYLISFYEGLQRVALFTEDRRIYKLLCESEKAELAEQEIILSLQDVGVSLVNNSNHQEVSFIGITRYSHTHIVYTLTHHGMIVLQLIVL
jgi:vacuolar protein sorting-associated protein 13A/C